MGKHICILQTSFAKRDDTIEYLHSKMSDLRIDFITDSSLLPDIRANGSPTKEVCERMTMYAMAAEKMGVDLILNTCSTAGDVADTIAQLVKTPIVRIDEPMAEEAAKLGDSIALISTLPTTIAPSRSIIQRKGREMGKDITVDDFVNLPAWDALQAGNTAEHNRILIENIRELDGSGKYNAIVMAQVSMRALLPDLADVKTPVLCSFYSGLDNVIKILSE